MPLRRSGLFAGALVAIAAILSSGCDTTGYVLRQGFGQLAIVYTSYPIDEAFDRAKLSDDERAKLRRVIEARDFARDRLGLSVGRSYQLFHDTFGQPVSYNLSASRKDALTPRQWRFPVIGTIDYIGYFNQESGRKAEAALQKEGYDTALRPVDAYSTLGYFPDPLHSVMLKRAEEDLVETVIHELAHNTVYANGQSTFNESLATFIGRRGALLFYRERGAEGAAAIARLEAEYADAAIIGEWLASFGDELDAYYGGQGSSAEKIAGREALFAAARKRFADRVQPRLSDPRRFRGWAELPTNNATILLHRRYNLSLDVMEQALDACGGDFGCFLDRLRAAGREKDPFAALRAGLR